MGEQEFSGEGTGISRSPLFGDPVGAARPSTDALEFLATRRSTLAKLLDEPGPSDPELADILRIGARVPDHRRLAPWRFVVVRDEARQDFCRRLEQIYAITGAPDTPEERDKALEKLASLGRVPVTICVVSAVRAESEKARRTPEWEQHLSVGAACQNLLLAASASGYAAQWVTEWYAYEPRVKHVLGLDEAERIAGFVLIGTAVQEPLERRRSDLADVVRFWRDGENDG